MASYTYALIELGNEANLGCKCCRFSDGIDLPTPKKLSSSEIETLALQFSKGIFADWTTLNAIIKRFEGTIQKRWLKKSSKQKRELLLKIWPDMAATHRPDFAIFRHNHLKAMPRLRTLPSAAFLWPYINLEDMQDRTNLLHFLNSRARNLPEVFIDADCEAAHLGKGWGDQQETITHAMIFYLGRTPRAYGEMVPIGLAKKPDVEEFRRGSLSRTQKLALSFPPALGLLLLEIQRGTYSFLLACAKEILHDIHPKQFFLAPHLPTAVVPKDPRECDPSFSSYLHRSPYQAPQMMGLEQLKAMVSARRCVAEDHLWMLREDPGYFIESVREEREHNRVALQHECVRTWHRIACTMLMDAFCFFIEWDQIYRILNTLPPLEEQLRTANHKTLRFSKKVEGSYAQLFVIVSEMIKAGPVKRLLRGVPASPRMRHCFKPLPMGQDEGDVWHPNMRTMTDAEYRVYFLFRNICEPGRREHHEIHHLVSEAQYMCETDPQACQLVDSWMMGHFSDLAMASELKLRVDGLQPWSRGWKSGQVLEDLTFTKPIEKAWTISNELQAGITDAFDDGVFDLMGHPSEWDYPASKSKTKTNVLKMRKAEARLDSLWKALDEFIEEDTGLRPTKWIRKHMSEPRKLYRTPKWVESTATAANRPALSTSNPNTSFFPRSELVGGAKNKSTPTSKIKIKTRGTPATPQDEPTQNTPSTSTFEITRDDPPPCTVEHIRIPKRAYKVFSALLPDANASDHQRVEIAWGELVQAFDAIGLSPQKLYGSVWMFSPKPAELCLLELKRSIQFHEPKEVRKGNKVPASMVRVLGRRLKYAFGWEGGMFCCE